MGLVGLIAGLLGEQFSVGSDLRLGDLHVSEVLPTVEPEGGLPPVFPRGEKLGDGIADVDLYPTRLNSVCGQADLDGRTGVISLTRLRPEFWGEQPDYRLFLERSVNEVVYELGHTMGLQHCANPSCVMHFSNTLADVDRKTERLCLHCVGMLPRN